MACFLKGVLLVRLREDESSPAARARRAGHSLVVDGATEPEVSCSSDGARRPPWVADPNAAVASRPAQWTTADIICAQLASASALQNQLMITGDQIPVAEPHYFL
jgi:hypothetical protein